MGAQEKTIYLIEETNHSLSEDILNYASDIQASSSARHKEQPPLHIHAVEKLHMQATNYYQAIARLCESGWAHTAHPISRVILECFANMAVIFETDNSFRAFKWASHEHFYFAYQENGSLGPASEIADLEDIKSQIRASLYVGLSDSDKKRADEYLERFQKNKKPAMYWYVPQYKGPRSILSKFAPSLLLQYNLGGNASHAASIGFDFFRTPKYEPSISARYDPYNANLCLIVNSRYLLELCYLRNFWEKLGLDDTYQACLLKIHKVSEIVNGLKEKKNE